MDYKIRIRSAVGALTLSPRSVCRVLDGGLKGFDAPVGELTLKNAAAESGGYPVMRRIRSRDLSVTFEVTDAAAVPYYRDLVMRMADPRADAEIETDMWGRTRKLSVIPDGTPEFTFQGNGGTMRVRMDFTACSPFFRGVAPVSESPASGVPLLSFPLTMLSGAGAVTGMTSGARVVRVNNPGDRECGFRLILQAAGGPVVKPMITCRGLYIRPFGTLNEGEELTVVTEPGNKGVFRDGLSVGFYSDSTFFGLLPGENTVSVSASNGAGHAVVGIEFTPLYYGS